MVHMKSKSGIYNNKMKHNNRRKNSLLSKKFVCVFSTLMLSAIVFWSMGTTVNAKENKPLYKYYQSYMVEKDDTLFSIAYDLNDGSCSNKQIQECVNEMISINSLDHKGTICYGNYIIVPYYSTEYR